VTQRGFLGQTEDPTGLDYLNNRYYDPTLTRFISVDPAVASTAEPYAYANNNPVTYSDPTGLDPWRDIGQVLKSAGRGALDGLKSLTSTVIHEVTNPLWMPEQVVRSIRATGVEDTVDGAVADIRKSDPTYWLAELQRKGFKSTVNDYAYWNGTQLPNAILAAVGGLEVGLDASATEAAGTGGIETTAHGATRIAGEAATRGGVLSECR
jgi:RHS repeat-associated protein